MSELDLQLNQLIAWLQALNMTMPEWQSISILERTMVEWDKAPRVYNQQPITAIDYADRFEALIEAGFAWLNLNAAGVLNGNLLVVVEAPHNSIGCPRRKVSVNFSGPEFRYLEKGWLLDWKRAGIA